MDPLDNLIEALTARLSEKAAGSTPGTSSYAHGPGGIASLPGQRAQFVNAMVMPFGLIDRIPVKRSVFATEVYPILTGQTGATGSNQSTICGDCKQPGNLKVCNQTWPFSRLCLDSQVLQVDRLGLLNNRSEFVDQTIVGDMFGSTPNPVGDAWNPQNALRDEKAKQLLQLFVDWKRLYAGLAFTGNPANNSLQNGQVAYGEAYGLDYILNTGYRDAYTGVACSAADPLVIDFGNLDISENANAAVTMIVEAYAHQKYLSERVGLDPVRYAFAMRYSLFRMLTAIWPCTYYTALCRPVSGSGGVPFLSADEMRRLTDDMRQQHYLLIDGEQVEVIVDSTITETIPVSGTAQSDLYLVPMSSPKFAHNAGGAITYAEYFDMTAPVQMVQEGMGAYPYNTFQAVNGGRFLVYPKAPQNTCIQYGMITKDRLIVEAPFLGARITGLRYTFQYHERNWNPVDPYYFYNGGQYYASAPYFYPPRNA